MTKTLTLLLPLLLAGSALGQGPTYQKPESPVPVITGFGGFTTTFEPGQQTLQPTIAPIVLIPLGQNWLIEGEGEFEGSYTHQTNQPWEREWDKGLEYLQVDYFANRYVTVVGGRFLTPFGIFNERLHSGWIRNTPIAPLIADSLEMTDSTGGMLRGGFSIAPNAQLNYAAYFSAASTVKGLVATRAAGGRASIFLPRQRLELGASYQRRLQDEHINTFGFDLIWQSNAAPFDVRAEYAHNPEQGSGYWIEGAYRTRKLRFARPFFRKSQAFLRFEQVFAPSGMAGTTGGSSMDAAFTDAQRFFAGWNYWIKPDVKASFAYGRNFSTDDDHNLWVVGITYRFSVPLGRVR